MFVYNITTKVDHSILDEWILWQKEIHIPEIMATNLFIEYKFYQLLGHDDEGGKNFVVQFIANGRADYDTYLEKFASQFQKRTLQRWGDKTVSFRTLLQNVQ
ncbi:MAG: DUF4286 family protein [Ginsengibacter sp.]